MRAGRFNVCELHAFVFEPSLEITVNFDQTVIGASGNPKQLKSLVGSSVNARKFCIEVLQVHTT